MGQESTGSEFRAWTVSDSLSPLDEVLEPTVRAADFEALLGEEEIQTAVTLACERSPWFWLVNFCILHDEHYLERGEATPYGRLPAYEYLRSIAYILWAFAKTCFPKSRQVLLTWMIGCYVLGEAMFQDGYAAMFQSKREADAVKILRRIRGVYVRMKHHAPWLGPEVSGEWSATQVEFENGSTIEVAASGAHQVQSRTLTRWIPDEAQLQTEMEESYYQALPAVERITVIGSVDFGWMWEKFLPNKLMEADA